MVSSLFGGSSGQSLRGLRAGFPTVPACGSVRRPATARKEQDRFETPRIIEKIRKMFMLLSPPKGLASQ